MYYSVRKNLQVAYKENIPPWLYSRSTSASNVMDGKVNSMAKCAVACPGQCKTVN